MRSTIVALFMLALSSPVYAVTIATFSVGLPQHVSMGVGTPTAIAGTLTNTGEQTLDFGCATVGCEGINVTPQIGVPFPTNQYLSMVFGSDGLTSFRDQFAGLVLSPDETVGFTLATFTFNQIPPPELLRFSISFTIFSSAGSSIGAGNGVVNTLSPRVQAGPSAQELAFYNLDVINRAGGTPPMSVPDHGPMTWMTALVFGGLLLAGRVPW